MSFRPFQKAVSRREAVVYTKAVRALAHKEGLSANEALAKQIGYRTSDRDKPWQSRGFHPDRLREDRVSHVQVDDGMLYLDDEDVYDFDFPKYEERTRQTDMTVSLIDLAKPARRRKVHTRKPVATLPINLGKDYGHLDDFVELDHDDSFSVFSEDWEDLYNNDGAGHERTYASVLRGDLVDPPHRTSIPD